MTSHRFGVGRLDLLPLLYSILIRQFLATRPYGSTELLLRFFQMLPVIATSTRIDDLQTDSRF